MEIDSLSISLGEAIALLRQSRWEAAHEIRRREWRDAPPADSLCVVLRADREELSARTYNLALLLRSTGLPCPNRFTYGLQSPLHGDRMRRREFMIPFDNLVVRLAQRNNDVPR
jgi:hypothetical protein